MKFSSRRWMQVVGVIYVLMGVRLLPWINGPMIEAGLNDRRVSLTAHRRS
jgi:hypothetical protein